MTNDIGIFQSIATEESNRSCIGWNLINKSVWLFTDDKYHNVGHYQTVFHIMVISLDPL